MANTPKLRRSTNNSEETVEELTVVKSDIQLNSDGESEVLEMLAGYVDESGVVHKTYTIREMTGRDEEAISQIKDNGSKIISTLLERCVLTIGTLSRKELGADKWKSIIKSLLVPDQDIMLLKIRALSLGEEVEASHLCPNCKTKLNSFINLEEFNIIPFHGNRVVNFELPKGYKDRKGELHTTGTMRMSTGLDREILTPLANKNLARANTVLLTRLCKFDDGLIITEDTMSDLTSRDREYLLNLMKDNLFGVDTTIEITCTNCGDTFSAQLNATNFI